MEPLNDKCQRLLQELYNSSTLDYEKISHLLSEIRVLTREKSIDTVILDRKCIDCLVECSAKFHTEAQKCLSNLILNYSNLRDQLIEPYVSCVEFRWMTVLNEDYQSIEQLSCSKKRRELLYYDLRIIFLLSALCSSSRLRIRDRILECILEVTKREAEQVNSDNYTLIVESLKTLFNLTLEGCSNNSLIGSVITNLFAAVEIEDNEVKNCETDDSLETADKLLVNLIHLMTNMPEELYLVLSPRDANKILNHLDHQLKTYSKQNFRDTVLPVLNVCANVCKYNKNLRKSWFDEIIGSAQDFKKRPEEYDNLRGRLVRLMTSLDVHIKDIAAEFIFALCDGDTEKFITYTGFGNSAAFLSSRGLLKNDGKSSSILDGSSCYEQLRHKIDPITGKLESQRKDPMEGMTEEEKEFHASELADAITKLSNLGVLKLLNNGE